MATKANIEALEKTTKALKDIHAQLRPLLAVLREEDDGAAPRRRHRRNRALAQAAIALSLGTLRFVGHRLSSTAPSTGRHDTAQLRKELNQMRKLLVQLKEQADEKEKVPKEKVSPKLSRKHNDEVEEQPPSSRRKFSTKRKGEKEEQSPAPQKRRDTKEEGSPKKRRRGNK
jgi:hypothetical protein